MGGRTLPQKLRQFAVAVDVYPYEDMLASAADHIELLTEVLDVAINDHEHDYDGVTHDYAELLKEGA